MDIRNILYKSIEQQINTGASDYKLFEADGSKAYTIRVYIDSTNYKFSFEVNGGTKADNYKIENYLIADNSNVSIYKNNNTFYAKFTPATTFTIRKEIVYGYLTDANTTNTTVAGNSIITLTSTSPKHIFAGNSSFVGNTSISGDTNITGDFTANNDVTVNGVATLGDASSDSIKFNANTTVKGTTTIDKDFTANNQVTVNGSTTLGDASTDNIKFNADTTVNGETRFEKKFTSTTNATVDGEARFQNLTSNTNTTISDKTTLSGTINFHDFYINDFYNQAGSNDNDINNNGSKIVFVDKESVSKKLEIHGIYNEILQPITVDDSVYQGKITILVSISNATLSESTQGAAELILLELVGTSQPEQKYQVVYIQSSSSIEIRSIKSNNEEVLSTIMIGGSYIINTITIPFANNITCKVTKVYLKEEGSAITIYKVADKIISGGESDSDASHYLLTAQSLSQILTLSSLSAGATTTNLTKNPDSTFDYDGGKNYLIYQTGSNTTNLYLTNNDSNERYIYSQNRHVKNRIGTTASTANTIVIRDDNNNINTGSLTASSVNAEGLDNAGKIIVSGDTSTGTLSITGKLTSGATTVSGTSNLASLIATGDVTVTGTSQLKSQFIANGNVTVTGAATLGDNASDAINFNSGTTIKGTSTLASLIANGNVTVNGAATLGDAASDNINFNATTTIKGTATLGDNASDQINFNAATTVKGTANFKSTLDANGGAVVTGKATLSSLTANGGVDVNGTTNLGDNTSDQIRFNAATTIKGTAFVNGRINFGQVNESDAASIYATNDSTTSGIIFSIADDNEDYFAFRSSHWENGAKDILNLTYTNITAGSNFIPLSNNTYNIGSTSNKWKNLYVDSIDGKFNTSLTIRGNGTDVATYNGSDNKVVNIAAGTNISILGNATNGTITIGHQQHNEITSEARWDENHNNLYIRNVKTDISGHVTSYPEQQVDLYNYYLRSDTDDTKNGSTTFNGPVTVSNIITLAGDKLNTSNGLLSGTPSLVAGQGRIYGNAIGFTNSGVATDVGWMRVLGTGESDTVLELATGDDGGNGESIHFRGYTTSGAIGYDVAVPKENGTILTTSSAKIEKTSDELFSITINGKTITFKQTGGEGSPLEITCS